MKPAREGAPGFTLLPRGAADAPPQTRLRFSGQHRDAAVLSGSWSPDALIESTAPMQEPAGRGRGESGGRGQKNTDLASAKTLQTFGKNLTRRSVRGRAGRGRLKEKKKDRA